MKNHMWTKEQIKKIVAIWDTTSKEDVAKALEVKPEQVQYIVTALRASGIKLARKHRGGYMKNLIEEVKKDLKIK